MPNFEIQKKDQRTPAAPIGGADRRAGNEIADGYIITANEQIGSGADESGERRIKTDTGELREKLQQIRT